MILTRRRFAQVGASVATIAAVPYVQAQEKLVFGLNWKADPSHGGYFQSVVDGTYRRAGLDVEIQQGGPQMNTRPLLAAGKIDFLMTGNMLHLFDNAKQRVPTVAVGAIFQKDPQCMIAHPGQGMDTWESLKRSKTVYVSKDGQFSFWQWMKTQGFRDEQLKPFNYSMSQFLADKGAVQQGYAFGEPVKVEAAGGFRPVVHLLSDQGWSTYSSLIETRRELVDKKAEVVQKFVDASIAGWYNYLYGDGTRTNESIKKMNPDITDDYITKSMQLVRQFGIIDSGDALTRGIGAMSDERMRDFFNKTIASGLVKAGEFDLATTYTTRFVNKGVGLDVKKRLGR